MDRPYRIAVLGGSTGGKTSLILRFITNSTSFLHYLDPASDDAYRKGCSIDGESVVLEVIDSQNVEYSAFTDQIIRSSDGFLIVYSVTSRAVFEELKEFHDKVLLVKDEPSVPMVIVGNKCDLESERQVPSAEGEELAKEWNCPFFETSMMTGHNVETVFFQVVRQIWASNVTGNNSNEAEQPKKKEKCLLM